MAAYKEETGHVNSRLITTLRIDITANEMNVLDELESVALYLNGHPLARMHPSRAEKFGLIHRNVR